MSADRTTSAVRRVITFLIVIAAAIPSGYFGPRMALTYLLTGQVW
ncbi:MAG: hypothetical protein Q4G43_07085 [Mobilicoccus sp.]|nr:hypothetical protein [Mobilicoccus sp.]